jgi:hypothetical protein
MLLLIVAMVFVIIGVSVYLIEVAGQDAQRQWWLMLPSAALAALVVWRGSRWFDRGPRVIGSEDLQRQFELGLKRRREELQRHPDPRFRKYAALAAEGWHVPDTEIRRREARLAEIAADPVKMKYADRIVRGEPIDDDTIAYWEAPSSGRACRHLAGLEADLRAADPTMRPWYGGLVSAFGIDWPRVRERYRIADPVRFEPAGQDERGEPFGARLYCDQHKSSILFAPDGPMFPL